MFKFEYRLKKFQKIFDLRLIIFLLRTKSKIKLLTGIIKNFDLSLKSVHFDLKNAFEKFIESKSIDEQWKKNTNRFLIWISIFERNYSRNKKIKILEIGSCQGHSALFFLWYFKKAYIDCVDIWDVKRNEIIFDNSLNQFSERLNKHKLWSIDFFSNKIKKRGIYDIVFIDGSHHSEEVLSDCLHCFQLLKVNGLMIIDDVFFMCNDRYSDNSLKAIDLFLDLKKQDLKILKLNSQLFIEKKADLRMDSSKKLNY